MIPGLFGLAALVLGVVVARWSWLHDSAGQLGYRGEVASAQNVLTTIAAAMLAFMAVVFSATLVALQLASGQFSPRVLRTFQRDRRTQVVQGTFLATFVYTLTDHRPSWVAAATRPCRSRCASRSCSSGPAWWPSCSTCTTSPAASGPCT